MAIVGMKQAHSGCSSFIIPGFSLLEHELVTLLITARHHRTQVTCEHQSYLKGFFFLDVRHSWPCSILPFGLKYWHYIRPLTGQTKHHHNWHFIFTGVCAIFMYGNKYHCFSIILCYVPPGQRIYLIPLQLCQKEINLKRIFLNIVFLVSLRLSFHPCGLFWYLFCWLLLNSCTVLHLSS